MTDNMRIWNALAKTDPKHTKAVSFGARKFTSIDAHWQIQRMTEQFGPVGEGWGYEAQHSIASMGDLHLAVCDVTIWWGPPLLEGGPGVSARIVRRNQYGPVRGTAELYITGKRLDDDAPKKCLTDALTKGLSHLGVSADVFLGLYDDNKYVQKVAAEFAAQPQEMAQEPDVVDGAKRWVSDQKGVLALPMTMGQAEQWKEKNAKALQKLSKNHPKLWDDVMMAYETKVEALKAL